MTLEEQESYICTQLRRERENLKMSQMELSFASGVSQNMITYIETGKRTPTINTILKLCNAMKINPANLFPPIKTKDNKETAKRTVLQLIQDYM